MLVAPWRRIAKRMLPHRCAAENTQAGQATGTRAVVVIAQGRKGGETEQRKERCTTRALRGRVSLG